MPINTMDAQNSMDEVSNGTYRNWVPIAPCTDRCALYHSHHLRVCKATMSLEIGC